MTIEYKLQQLIDSFGLEELMLQNDLEEIDILEMLVDSGKIDVEDYFYTDIEEVDEDD